MKKYLMNKVNILLLLCVLLATGCKWGENKNIRSGNSAYKNSKFSEAAAYYSKAIESNPSSQNGLFNLSDAYYKLKQYKEAKNLLQEIIPVVKGDSSLMLKLYYNLGDALFSLSLDIINKNNGLKDEIQQQQNLVDEQSGIQDKVKLSVQLDSMITIQDSMETSKDLALKGSMH